MTKISKEIIVDEVDEQSDTEQSENEHSHNSDSEHTESHTSDDDCDDDDDEDEEDDDELVQVVSEGISEICSSLQEVGGVFIDDKGLSVLEYIKGLQYEIGKSGDNLLTEVKKLNINIEIIAKTIAGANYSSLKASSVPSSQSSTTAQKSKDDKPKSKKSSKQPQA